MSVHAAYADPRRELPFYGEEDRRLLALLPFRRFLAPSLRSLPEEALTRRTAASSGRPSKRYAPPSFSVRMSAAPLQCVSTAMSASVQSAFQHWERIAVSNPTVAVPGP